ncbi:MAG: amino acid transporter [Armatimonadetes bacterium]|nr:amino acid transporter [Armatimonadota bacterium]
MCLTGVDYFSTLGYQPGIAALAAGALSPFATLVLVLLTLFGALPMYRRVAGESPHGDGSISMLEKLLPFWQGKLFVLCLIGFAATGFIITITLSAADATAHVIENPFAPHWMHGKQVPITLLFIGLLGAVFLKGFGEAIGIAVALVVVYIGLNLVVVAVGFKEILTHPEVISNWRAALFTQHPNVLAMLGASLLFFPKLALGLSGFETGVVVMPLVKGDPTDTPQNPAGRIRNARKLLTAAALIMSVMLLSSSLVTTLLIPHEAFLPPDAATGAAQGQAYGRALAYIAHKYLGGAFGTLYDVSTILILWFAGSSAMAGLLNIVPRYLPRYGMAPDWTRAVRPLALIFTLISFAVTIYFRAGVEAQAGAYATGVLALMTSATIAVTLSAKRAGQRNLTIGFGVVALIFIYTTAVTLIQRPEGLGIALVFIASIVGISLLSRVSRTLELRVERVELDEAAQSFVAECAGRGVRIIANKRQDGDAREYALKEDKQREDSHIPASLPILFLEVEIVDASEFSSVLQVRGVDVEGYRVLRAQSSTVPNAIAALLLHLRDMTGKRPHAYFNWSEGHPIVFMMRYLLLGEGDTAPVTREVLRKAERDPEKRPMIHVDG